MSVDPELTYAQPWPEMTNQPQGSHRDTLVLGIHYRDRWQSCELRMNQIREIQGTEIDGGNDG